MGGTGPGAMGGKRHEGQDSDVRRHAMHGQMMEKRMETIQSMMQMMMDRMQQPAAKQ